ncbi:hypothetical protein [Dehalobacter sp. TeCB1]|uniref:hypothetical protein n=1 Tax=Dehalobacter sp. TeCB1 TaxID=1843715 RepID=UPI00083B7504|nr:hypothetical protein [Dehalobacter sp. TeCB1]OCZ54243.1 hypothetical protein A7D23_05590 [Dehalobacter sp. TeCB1]
MIGFDRPLKPQWIYESLLLAQPGQKLTEFNHPFEQIARELTGKEGKRKVRTVLVRCFLRDPSNRARVRPIVCLKELSEKYGLDFMSPIYLFYLISSTETLINISEHIFRLYEWETELNLAFLQRKMIEGSGDRDVVARSARSFIKTLAYFGLIADTKDALLLNKPLSLDEQQAAIMLQLWARELRHTPQIDLRQLPPEIFNWFTWPDLRLIARKYNGEFWDYQHRMGGEYLGVYTS